MEESYFTKSNNLPWVLFTFFKLYKWYHIVKSISYTLSTLLNSNNCCFEVVGAVNLETTEAVAWSCFVKKVFLILICKIHRKTLVLESRFISSLVVLDIHP